MTTIILDEERQGYMNKIIELLLAAGYSRARLPFLSNLDKILGGFTWGLTSCFFDIEFEFTDDMNIGEKIKVSERIIKGLKSGGCPILINPVQIQGLDLKVLYSVFQWLIKYVHESRDKILEVTDKVAFSYGKVVMGLKKESQVKENKESKESKANHSKHKNEGRQLRFKESKLNMGLLEQVRIYLILCEYGIGANDLKFQKELIDLLKKKKLGSSNTNNNDNNANKIISNDDNFKGTSSSNGINSTNTNLNLKKESSNQTQTPTDQKKERQSSIVNNKKEKITEKEKEELNEILNKGEILQQTKINIEADILNDLLNNNFEVIQDEIQKFEVLNKDDKYDEIKIIMKEKERLLLTKGNLQSQIEFYNEQNKEIDNNIQDLKALNNIKINEINKLNNEITQSNHQISQLNEKVLTSNNFSKEQFEKVTSKIEYKENVKEDIVKYKQYIKQEKIIIDMKLENVEKKKMKMGDESNLNTLKEIDESYNDEMTNLINKKKALFEENKVINMLTRKIQVYPSKLELLQFQKRFEELYEQINLISERNREMINEINSKEEVSNLLNQKKQTFQSLLKVYSEMKSVKEKESLKNSIVPILNEINEIVDKTNKKCEGLSHEFSSIKNENLKLQEYEQNYMRLIKEFNYEYNKGFKN